MMAIDQDESPAAESLIPPRPNLGPEPWPDQSSWAIRPTSWVLAFTLVFFLLFMLWWRRRRRSTGKRAGSVVSAGSSIELDPSPRQRLIESSEKVREALMDEFGTSWRSRTTEEIIDDSRLTDRLGPEEVDRLVQFLRLSDRAKFAVDEPETLEDWPTWADAFVEGLGAKSSRG